MQKLLTRSSLFAAILTLLFATLVQSHTVIVYPGWRGNTLHSNGTVDDTRGLPIAPAKNGSGSLYPYGMQWLYPCGGMPQSLNRTKWPVTGGAISFQPGWFSGHKTAFIYMNLGLGTIPLNMSHPMVPPFQIVGPTAKPYPGTFCLPQVPLPTNITVKVGDNATIQVVETAVHGAALYNCVDITFADVKDVEPVTKENCFNSTEITHKLIYSLENVETKTSGSPMTTIYSSLGIIPLLLAGYYMRLTL
ncbi:hypothetical protein FQN57_002160 [Myotisia sp. PD_48]|nr:hypothetical protein FQN57_002160 [Myotisia sp. PD_48]